MKRFVNDIYVICKTSGWVSEEMINVVERLVKDKAKDWFLELRRTESPILQ